MEVRRLERELSAFLKLTYESEPRKRLIRVRDRATTWYLMGDTSQYGFGTDIFAKGYLMFESGYWDSCKKYKNSNWQKAEKTFTLTNNMVSNIVLKGQLCHSRSEHHNIYVA